MAKLRRLGLPLLAFFAVLALVAASGAQRPLDYAAYRFQLSDRHEDLELSDEIRLVDLPYPTAMQDRGDPTLFRARLAELLGAFAADPANLPKAVVLDIWFSKDDRGLAPLAEAIRHLEQSRVPTYASFNPEAEGRADFDALMREHAQTLYQDTLTGYGHTLVYLHRGILSYKRELGFPTPAGTRYLRALPSTVARDLQWPDAFAASSLVVPVGNERSVDERTVKFVHEGDAPNGGRFVRAGAPAPVTPDFRGAVVVVGSFAADVHAGAPQAGPKLVAWALDDARRGHRNARVPLDHPGVVAGLVIALGLVTIAAFGLLFKFVAPLQSRPAVLALGGTLTGAIALFLVGAACYAMGFVMPVGLGVCAIVLAAGLGWRYASRYLAAGAAEGSGQYDVFISYSRSQGDWVAENVFKPLSALRKADGQPLKIFFDRTEIDLGEAFTAKYMWAIVESRVFVPVFSADYYGKNHCRNEMDLAFKRHVDKRLRIAPIALAEGAVPEIFSVLNYIDVRANPRFIDEIARIVLGAPEGARA